ncbi:MAG: nitrile hydratase subunit beta [bacterium]|nr:nitrile hydratase subunit beta [bacterium]
MPLLTKDMVPNILKLGGSFQVDVNIPPKFSPGDRIRARDINPEGHTRLPRFARGRQGVIDKDYGVFVFPDTLARGEGKKPQHLYSVRFMARELWGPEAGARDSVYLDLWDDYMDPA